ncbi:MAG: hypothetical protein AAF518_28155 [Spirochaetota bacterium]
MRTIFISLLLLCTILACANEADRRIGEYIRHPNYRRLAIRCSENKTTRYVEECKNALERVENDINNWISASSGLSYIPLSIPEKQKEEIDRLLQKNVLLDVKYGLLWHKIFTNK